MRIIGALALIAAFACAAAAQQPQDDERDRFEGQARPLLTEDVEVLRPGTVRLQAGVAFAQDQDFALSGLNGDITRIGDIGIRIGVSSNVEVQIDGTVQQFLSINRQFSPSVIDLDLGTKPGDTQDVGDFTLATKIKVTNERRGLPGFGFRFGFELPNTNQTRGLGTNTVNVFADVLAAKTIGPVRLLGNVGIGILTSPTETFSQNDVLRYGVAFRAPINGRIRLVGEINGRHSTRHAPIGTEDRSEARLGFQVDAAGLRWDAAGSFGLTRWSPQTGVVFGVTYDIKESFEPAK